MVLSLLILTVAISIAVPEATLVAGALTLLSALIGLLIVRGVQLIISLVLVGCGLAALIAGLLLGDRPDLADFLTVNQDLIAMLAAVSFVRLITTSTETPAPRLSGAKAVWRTAAAVHLLGSVINISAINLIGERLGKDGRLSRLNELLLSRSFSAGAFWSPFWGATAAAIAYAPGAKSNVLILCGLCLALVALTYSITATVRRFGPSLGNYHGYVLTWRALRIPLALAVVVLGLHTLIPETPITRLVLVGSLGITVVTLFFIQPRTAGSRLFSHVRSALPRLSGELTLFASAGVLAIGLGSFFNAVQLELPVTQYTIPVAWATTLVMAMLSLVGVHPVISIAAVAAVIVPLHPDPTLYAMSGMIAWGASAAAGPISGLNIYLNGRFGTNNFAIARRNLPYFIVVLALAWPVLWLCDTLA
ncbi:hypothetical protein [Microbacterium sp. AK031]|uniref:hypothetical protein n=1 Tax=Microbacterium sp. AK031 TaxID=2723076 RepID=UPI0021684D09|nr:hypothetical protein [Microbacterium sp. AK031]MCS3843379.1 hypothetical protein [Microbacterium sp. AK031]